MKIGKVKMGMDIGIGKIFDSAIGYKVDLKSMESVGGNSEK